MGEFLPRPVILGHPTSFLGMSCPAEMAPSLEGVIAPESSTMRAPFKERVWVGSGHTPGVSKTKYQKNLQFGYVKAPKNQ